jgi:hypothetical protein
VVDWSQCACYQPGVLFNNYEPLLMVLLHP